MLPIRMGVLEMPSEGAEFAGRRQPERLSQCLVCGALVWSRPGREADCRCSVSTGLLGDPAKRPEMARSRA